jgi:hypothetical protein
VVGGFLGSGLLFVGCGVETKRGGPGKISVAIAGLPSRCGG